MLVATCLAGFTATLDNTVVAVALRDVQRDLGAGVTGLQGIVTAYTVVLAALLLAGGALVDVLGPKRVLLAGLTVFALASAGCASSGSVSMLIAARAVQGLGAALLLPGSLAVLAGAYPAGSERARAVGVWAATSGLALVAGPVAGGLLVAAQGWQAVFWINVPLCAALAGALVWVPATEPTSRRRLDLPGVVLSAVVLGSAAYAVVLAGRSGWTPSVAVCLAVAVVGVCALAVAERRPGALLPMALLRNQMFSGAMMSAFAAALAVFVLLVFLSLFLQLVQERTALSAGLVLLPLPAALVVTAPLGGRWRHGPRVPVVVGLVLAGAGVLVLGRLLQATTSTATLFGLLAVIGAGLGLTTAPAVTAALATAGQDRSGIAAASVNVARELGGVVAVAGLGALAVARLSQQLTVTLTTLGVSQAQQPRLLDALLGARTDEVRALVLQAIGLDRSLQLGSALTAAATSSFVSSTRLVCSGAGLVLVGAAASTWVLFSRGGGDS